jgi:hypothetical protein
MTEVRDERSIRRQPQSWLPLFLATQHATHRYDMLMCMQLTNWPPVFSHQS